MSSEFDKNLEKYIDLTLKVGLNLQQNQRLIIGLANPINIGTPIELAPFVRLIVKKAYQMGARFVDVLWNDVQIQLIRYQNAPRDSFKETSTWRMETGLDYLKKGDAVLAISVQDPDIFIGQDSEQILIQEQAIHSLYKPVTDLIVKNAANWCMITAPINGWTEKVLSEPSSPNLIAKLWDIIFEICRVKQKDPISAWREHVKTLRERCNYLDKKQYKKLKITDIGTDLTLGLPNGHIWRGGSMTNQRGITFVPNLPTEEIFTLPHKDETEGTVSATKPLFTGSAMIEDLTLTFSNGKVANVTAKKGLEHIEKYIKFDEGASYLGEIALVPHSSPISQSGLLFYNGLIDENASIHLALGAAYQFSLKNGEELTSEEFSAIGGNDSMLHLDFMIGSGETNVEGIQEDGTIEPIIKKGEWAFKA
ncbi:MAG: aminopeptidase [Promethearchaeota archaeon]|jgi:aminopeptidase